MGTPQIEILELELGAVFEALGVSSLNSVIFQKQLLSINW